ncbi:hypothetical protein LGL08_22660 [Clostridium estertheticum]|uniref:hypothetical protein n=1 Tax=Clostridium estertheticum TaxID=238834 RepID=UPI001CF28333|nr:hypothetical protein [Clostridium estertheticum]MCB2309360.1 hypothetical protein [Clostridium estertheticum]MCB2347774.1 hypothetical protein [Clostridium estertheticum]MCB2352317.1 hypothetical protein [Clostridium estertheticum]WAG44767.1 hypothetical protein LL127_14525 [Clostridium estertheticum]
MGSYNSTSFLGDWKLNNKQNVLNIEKTGETYKCVWKINGKNTQNEYLGIGMIVDNQLYISRFLKQVPGGGVGLYKPIGDLRSNSSLWASTQNFNTLGSGITLRENASESFEGDYTVRYFIKGTESPVYNLKIQKKKQSSLYSLTWDVNNEVKLHGVGVINNGQMVLAWGGVEFEYEVIILSIENENTLNGKCALLSNNITQESYTKC